MKLVIGIMISIVLAVITSSLGNVLILSGEVISALYNVSGIMFSIGMSLLVTSNTSDVKNQRIKKTIRKQMKEVCVRFLMCFTFVTVIYIFLYSNLGKEPLFQYKCFVLNASDLMVVLMAYSIFYFTANFLSIRKLNAEIEDAD